MPTPTTTQPTGPAPTVTVIHQYQPAARARAALVSRLHAIAREAAGCSDPERLTNLDNEAVTVEYRIQQLDQAEAQRQAWHERVTSVVG